MNFPKEAYDCQIKYMEHVMASITNQQNALLESPTGTGKTLCLLCAVLAWQASMKQANRSKTATGPGNKKGSSNTPVILYASRTHTQLSQVVGELKATSYKPKMVVLGSRDQLCINPRMSKHKGVVLNTNCSALCAQRKCMYRNNLDSYTGAAEGSNGASSPIMDIEDLLTIGKKDSICGYYYSREEVERADLVLLPYNYLLDPVVRATVNVDWKNVIIIFDEAHNLERSACDAASVSINSSTIASVIKELKDVIRILQNEQSSTASDTSKKDTTSSSITVGGVKVAKPQLQAVADTLKSVFELENCMDTQPLRHDAQFGGDQSPRSMALPGHWLMDTLERVGFRYEEVQ